MGGIIDFNTSCPWELYLFAFLQLAGAIVFYLFDTCRLLHDTACTDTELVFENMAGACFLYAGVVFTVLTYHNKQNAGNITRLSNMALHCSTAFLASVVFAGNASFGGIERSWMHKGDVLTMMILVGVLMRRVTKTDAEWAERKPLEDGMGVNCKTLLNLFWVLTIIKFFAFTDFIDPLKLLADGSYMTDYATWMWQFTAVLMLEIFLAILYAVLFDDNAGHELLVVTIMVLTVVVGLSFSSVQQYMSSWMGLNTNRLWTQIGIMLLVCLVAIVGGRRGTASHSGYSNVGDMTV
jgi:hypothetical protein